ncbi:MFS transporter [Falsiroseomonas sp.]|uniref:MFS transporter n=1 Tax=Falsiroseomonas sp. TaxID=2870721 RepID=UPI003568DD42
MSSGPGRFDWKGIGPRLTLALAAIVTVSVLALSQLAVQAFERAVEPELASRTRLVGTIVREAVQRPLERGIPFDALAGLDRYLAETLEKFDEVARIAVATVDGNILAEVVRPAPDSLLRRAKLEGQRPALPDYSLPILQGTRLVGTIEVRIRPDLVRTRLRDVFLDVLVIGLVATLVALELAFGLALAMIGKPLRRVLQLLGEQREGHFLHRIRPGGLGALGRVAMRLNDHAEDLAHRLAGLPERLRGSLAADLRARIAAGAPRRLRLSDIGDIRPALFLLSVATEIATAFLPVLARGAGRPAWLSPELAAAAPLLCYLVAIAALMPFGGVLVARFGARRLFVWSMPPIALALAGMGFAGSALEIALWRGVIGVFYATATVACQEYALGAEGRAGGSRAFGSYLAVVYAGVFSGSALGGVIAGRFGHEAAFLLGTVLAIAAAVVAGLTMTGRAGAPETPPQAVPPTPAHGRRPGARAVALLVGIAMPMNAAVAIFVWYLTPLMLAAAGLRTADVARVVMLYYLVTILLGPFVARLAERPAAPLALVIAGGFGSAAALLSLSVWEGVWAVAGATAALGAAHTLIRAPQYVLMLRTTAEGGASAAGLRLFERLGAIAGLAASTLLLRDTGAAESIRMLGLVVLGGAVLFVAIALARPLRRA